MECEEKWARARIDSEVSEDLVVGNATGIIALLVELEVSEMLVGMIETKWDIKVVGHGEKNTVF